MEKDEDHKGGMVYGLDDKPKSPRDWVIYSAQNLVTMVYAAVWGFAIVGLEMGYEAKQLTGYMSSIILTVGLSTLIQVWLGHRLAMVSGPNIIPSLAIVAAITAGGKEYAQQAFIAQVIAGFIIVVLTLIGFVRFIQKFWSPLVLGAMVMLVGLSISKQGLLLLTETGFNWKFAVGIFLALLGIITAIRAKGIWGTLSPLIIIVLGYVTFMVFDEFKWQFFQEPSLFVLPEVLPYGISFPPIDFILIMVVVGIMSSLNLYGNVRGYADVIKHKMTDRSLKRSFLFFGAIENCLPGLFGVPATVAYGENIGIAMLTRVASMSFMIVAAIVFIGAAFVGPIGGLMAAMPKPVAGALLLGIASSVIGIGINMMASSDFRRREQSLVGFSIFLSLGLFLLPEEIWKDVPPIVTTIFSNPIISVIIFILLFEKVLFRKEKQKK